MLAAGFLCSTTEIKNCPHFEKETGCGSDGWNGYKSVVSIDSSIDSEV